MKKNLLLLLTIFQVSLAHPQGSIEIDSLLNLISKTVDSKKIIETAPAKKLIAYKEKVLPLLAEFFTDTTQTKVISTCQKRNLTKGELAIIIADNIELMPYFEITGVQNCLLTFCEKNPNLIEYYLWAIQQRRPKSFQKKYIAWLASEERKKWIPLFSRQTKRPTRKEKRIIKRVQKKTLAN
ncbi:MAG TPA: hypothetical protein ENK46_05665 [Flavobacteriia bacterium]|nr:hypothetical protein [Flavobacteriia bacterium]